MNPLVTIILILVGIFVFIAGFILLYLKTQTLATDIIGLQSDVKQLLGVVAVDDKALEDYDAHSCEKADTCARFEHHTCPYLREGLGGIYRSEDEVEPCKRPSKVSADRLRP